MRDLLLSIVLLICFCFFFITHVSASEDVSFLNAGFLVGVDEMIIDLVLESDGDYEMYVGQNLSYSDSHSIYPKKSHNVFNDYDRNEGIDKQRLRLSLPQVGRESKFIKVHDNKFLR